MVGMSSHHFFFIKLDFKCFLANGERMTAGLRRKSWTGDSTVTTNVIATVIFRFCRTFSLTLGLSRVVCKGTMFTFITINGIKKLMVRSGH